MLIDLPTLMLAASFIAAASGIFLVFAWLQSRESWAILWWASANLILAASVTLLSLNGATLGRPSQIVAMSLLNVCPAMIWAAARSYNNRRPSRSIVVAGALLWLLAFTLPSFRASLDAQTFFSLSIVAIYLFAAGAEFGYGKAVRVSSRWPLIVLLFSHGTIFVISAAQAISGNLPLYGDKVLSSWFGFVLLEVLVFIVGTAIFVVAIDRERSELRQKTLASVDELTGVASRRAFFDQAERLLKTCKAEGTPCSMILFDLDHFKTINDTHGHMAGDKVLETFGACVRGLLRSADLVGRPGGEEFAIAIAGQDALVVHAIAERIRIAFSARCRELNTLRLIPTVSGGVATAHPHSTLESLYAVADRALYKAKQRGRNRVEIADDATPTSGQVSDLATAAKVA